MTRVMQGRAKILVIDDDPLVGKTLGDILLIKGYDVARVTSGNEGIRLAQEGHVSLALIDLNLPDMSGIEVMERIKSVSPLTEAIILTGNASLASAIDATNKGAFSYLLKPYQMDDLLLHIRHGVEKQQAQEEIIRLASHPRLNPNPVIEIDRLSHISYMNPAAECLFPRLQAQGLEHPLLAGLTDLLGTLGTAGDEPKVVREVSLQEIVYELHISYVRDSDLVRIYAIDVTERIKAQQTVEQLRSELELILNSAGEGIITLNAAGRHTLVNPAAALMLGYEVGELLDRPSHPLWHHSKANGTSYPEAESPMYRTLRDGQVRRREDEVFWRKDGSCFPVEYVCTPIRQGDQIQGVVLLFEDITQRKRAQEEIHLLATTDELTGILNRRAFTRIFDAALSHAKRYGMPLSLIMYDLDHFKRINDSHGHAAGDAVLKTAADIVKSHLRSNDTLARWGGEEFMILTPFTDLQAARQIADKLKTAISVYEFAAVGRVTASFGVTSVLSGDNVTTLLKRADDALYKAKENGRNRVVAIK